MPNLIRPPDDKDRAAFLRMLFLRTEQRLLAEIRRKRAQGYVEYAEVAALKRTQKILQDMVDESWDYVPAMIEKVRCGCQGIRQCRRTDDHADQCSGAACQ